MVAGGLQASGSTELFEVLREQLPQAAEALISRQVGTGIVQCPRNVLDIHGVVAVSCLEPERAECFEVSLQRHQVEPAAVIPILLLRSAALRQEKRDQRVDLLIVE